MTDYTQSDLVSKILMYVEGKMPKTTESEAARWARKAALFQEQFENSSPLIVAKSHVVRCAIVEWQEVSGDRRLSLPTKNQERVNRMNFHALIKNLRKNGARILGLRRIWLVVENSPFSTEPREIQRWERLVMALVHRDARNFHYTKWLMTKDIDEVNSGLTGGLKTPR